MDTTKRLLQITEAHLSALCETIWDGSCVAFVGAGFSAAARLPGWHALIQDVADEVPANDEVRQAVDQLLLRPDPGHRALEAAAQLLQDRLGREAFHRAVARGLQPHEGLTPVFLQRRRDLLATPFRAVLTTNFDPLLPGDPPGPRTYRQLLREGWGGPWDPCYWPGDATLRRGPGGVQLHGAVSSDRLVFARRDYRELLFANPAYLTFLKALFATRTVLFLGFSFRDAYLDLLRAELMQLVDPEVSDPPLAYAVLTDVTWAEALYLRRHEGMGVLWYPPTPDHRGFDVLLQRLADATNPVRRLGRRLAGARVLWLDPHPTNNALARRLLGDDALEEVADLQEALDALQQRPWDLVITHWGWRPDGLSNAQRLLDWMHRHDRRVPVVVFSSP
ncbi:MAG TPA: hypothetical protein ENK18_14245, partial [Deltaproteobacteria bacterium]|nr:hypothetical protein [Deltaproteobacteria bacterium]